jgi:hypothetical protein
MKDSTAEVTFQPIDVIGSFFDLLYSIFAAHIQDFFLQAEKKLQFEVCWFLLDLVANQCSHMNHDLGHFLKFGYSRCVASFSFSKRVTPTKEC